MEKKAYMTAREFAAKIKRPYPTVATWLRKGRVKGAEAHKLGAVTVWLIPVETATDFNEPKRGRPKKAAGEQTKTAKARKRQASRMMSGTGKSGKK
jgi:hypothetical protein